MSLNIKNEETCRLARELAELTGETITGAITVALRERLEHERIIAEKIRNMRAISKRCTALLCDGPAVVEQGDFLYEERGLPK